MFVHHPKFYPWYISKHKFLFLKRNFIIGQKILYRHWSPLVVNIARILPLTHPQLCSQTVIFTLDQSLLVLGSVTCNSNIVLTPDQTTNNTYQRWNSPKCQWVVRILNKGDSAYRICLHVSPSEYTSGKKSMWYLD